MSRSRTIFLIIFQRFSERAQYLSAICKTFEHLSNVKIMTALKFFSRECVGALQAYTKGNKEKGIQCASCGVYTVARNETSIRAPSCSNVMLLMQLHRHWRSHMCNNASLLYSRTRQRSQLKRDSAVLHLRVHALIRPFAFPSTRDFAVV